MLKNIKKSSALVAGTALVLSGLVAPAAQASEVLGLAPSAGTSYNTIHTSTFTLALSLPANVSSGAAATLKYRVQNLDTDGATAVDVAAVAGGTGWTENSVKYGTSSNAAGGGNDADGVTEADFVVTGGSGTNLGLVNTVALSLDALTYVGDRSFTITAFLDTNANNTIDSGEFVSPARTVKFVDLADVTGSVSLVTPIQGDATLTARVSLGSDINLQQVDARDIVVEFGIATSATDTSPAKIVSYGDLADNPTTGGSTTVTSTDDVQSNDNDVVFNTVLGVFEAVFTPLDTAAAVGTTTPLSVSASTRYTATLKFTNDAENAYVAEGLIGRSLTNAATIDAITINATGALVAQSAAAEKEASTTTDDTLIANNQAGAAAVKIGASSGTVTVFLGTDATKSLPINLATARVSVTSSSVSLSDGVEVNGIKVYNGGPSVSFTATTGINGKFSFPFTAVDTDASDTVTISVSGQGVTSSNYVITFTAAAYTMTAVDAATVTSTTVGGTVTNTYQVVDQWGGLPANGAYTVAITAGSNESRTKAPTATSVGAVVDGKATLSWKDNGTGTGSNVLTATLRDSAGSTHNSQTVTETVFFVADPTPAKVTMSALTYGSGQLNDANGDGDYSDTVDTDLRTKLALASVDFFDYDSRVTPTALAPEVASSNAVTVAGTVTNAGGSAVAGALVTIEAKGFLFGSGTRYVKDKITVAASSSGAFSVSVWSNVGGKQTVKVTSGAISTTVDLTYAAGNGSGATMKISTPSTSAAGQTVDVTVTVLDLYGNPAQGEVVTLSSTGPGYLLQTSVTTGRDGIARTKLLLGSNDAGVAKIFASADLTDAKGVTATTEVTSEVTVGSAAVDAVIGSFNGRVAVRVTGAKGAVVSVKIGRQWYRYSALNNNYLQSWRSAKGRSVAVSVYVDGELQNVQTITVR